LIQNIKKYYDDPKLQAMLENIITNPIDAPRGYKNPSYGIALRGPLSQFFSGIYLKPLDDALTKMNVTYLRYQDDILVLCKTKRQMNRCRRRMMEVLHERHLCLSRKKSRMGCIDKGFHFLGIDYLGTQTLDKTNVTHANDDFITQLDAVHSLVTGGG
jgi:RNA-directed DNA polymerase